MERPDKAIRELILVMQEFVRYQNGPPQPSTRTVENPISQQYLVSMMTLRTLKRLINSWLIWDILGVNRVDSLVAVIEIRYWIVEG